MELQAQSIIRVSLYLKDGRVISGVTTPDYFDSSISDYLMTDETDAKLSIGVPRRNVAFYNFRDISSDVAPVEPQPEEPSDEPLPGDSE